jgi:stearoyl-CoA desaturase (delta-9 desaturase)
VGLKNWIVRLFTVLFGAGAFENSVLLWSCEHRSHHKHVDHDEDPYCITKGLFYAHMGWLMFKLKPLPPFDNVADLRKELAAPSGITPLNFKAASRQVPWLC